MKLFKRVAIIGTGLIGGSMALAIKQRHLAEEIIGVSRHRRTLLLAKKNRVIDKGSQDINIIKDADLVVLSTPVSTILELAPKVARVINKDCIVTDVGSTKQEIVKKLEKLFPNFIGTHPLAGLEKRGVAYANPQLFKDSLCIFTPTRNTRPQVQKKIRLLWINLGARVVNLPVETHDEILSFVSHLPHVVAFSLMGIVPKSYLGFASSGLRDTTRIAASDSALWVDILLSNRHNALKSIELFQDNLSQIKKAIKNKDRKLLAKILRQAKERREILA